MIFLLAVLAVEPDPAVRDGTAPTTAPTSTPDPLDDFAVTEIFVSDETWTVAVADTPVLRVQGLMGVTDLGGLDGMLFVFEADTTTEFWMKDTLISLDIAFFDSDGNLVDLVEMEPCGDQDPCPFYSASGPYSYALEVPRGGFAGLGELTLAVP